MTQDEYVQAMPFLATWEPPELLPRFVEAMDELQGLLFKKPDLAGLIGVIIIPPGEPGDVRVITKERCAQQAKRNGLDDEFVQAILSPNHPGTLDILIFAGRYHVVIGMPAELQKVPRPGSESN